MLNVTVLVENSVEPISALLGEHGLSMVLETGGQSFLFDIGSTDVCVHNAHKLGVDLSAIGTVIFSHHHYDHVGGLKHLPPFVHGKRTVVAQAYAFYPRVNEENELAEASFRDQYTILAVDSEPFELTPDLLFLPRIPHRTSFEGDYSFGQIDLSGVASPGEPTTMEDVVPDDSVLLYRTLDGFVILSGCAHSGICNVVRYSKEIAKKKWNTQKVKGVVGGFHLLHSSPEVLEQTAKILKEEEIEKVGPCHCTALAAKLALAAAGLPVVEITTGTQLTFP